jgi:Holliday junction resolvase
MLEVTERHLRQKLRKDGLAPVHMPASSSMRWVDDTARSKSNRRNRKSPAILCLA